MVRVVDGRDAQLQPELNAIISYFGSTYHLIYCMGYGFTQSDGEYYMEYKWPSNMKIDEQYIFPDEMEESTDVKIVSAWVVMKE